MPVAAGTRLGPYEIVSPIGAGGMGEVYRARDTRLDRIVAIKVLPADFANDAQLRLRFEREAKAISQLSHPNICTLYDIGESSTLDSQSSTLYLVMELLDGETLASRLARGAMPHTDVVRYGIEIAEALEKAHRNGVVHRDLKPGNVMLTKAGAKLLDFGLAIRTEPTSVSATQQRPLTREGAVVGTYQYMSPEQIAGDPVDRRTDIYSLGLLLYEMASGKRAYTGRTTVSPPALNRLIEWCLAKDSDERIQSAHDVALELSTITNELPQRSASALTHTWIPWTLAALLAVLAFATWKSRPTQTREETRFAIPAPPGTNHYTHASISPNGRRIVFRAGDARGRTQLYLRDLGSTEVKALTGTDGAVFSFWAPDNRQVGFTARGKLLRLNVDTGEVRTLAENITQGGGASWGRDDVILFSPRPESILYRVNAAGGEPVPETKFQETETHHVWPWFLPDGEHYLFMTMGSDQARAGVFVGKLGSSERTRIMTHAKRTDFTSTVYGGGSIFYVRDFALMAQKFDLDTLKVTGAPVKIDEGMELAGPGRTTLSVSSDGTFLYRRSSPPVMAQFVIKDREARESPTIIPEGPFRAFALSPDEKRIVAGYDDSPPSSWVIDAVRGTATRVPFERYASFPRWLSDSRSYVVSVALDTPPNIYLVRDGTTKRLTRAFQQQYATGVSPDDAWVFFDANEVGGFDMNAVSLAPPHNVVSVLSTKFNEYDATPSLDGKWLAYVSNEGGPLQVFAIPWSAASPAVPGSKIQVSTTGGEKPRWSRDGRELYYLDPNRTITSVSIEVEDGELRASIPRALFQIDNTIGFEPMRDGRFLVTRTRLNPDATSLTVVEGWGR